MNKKSVGIPKQLTFTILSLSLLTVMGAAAVAPALGIIREHFRSASPLLVQLVITLPALFIIITNLLFPLICRFLRTRTLALLGLTLYVVAGSGAFLADNIVLLLSLRALLGVSIGLIMPLSTGLLAYYHPPEEQAQLMGLASAMNQLGGVIATFSAGMLASIAWNYTFLVYAIGLVVLVLVVKFMPNEQLTTPATRFSPKALVRFHPSVVGMLLLMILFFIYPTNFAITAPQTVALSHTFVTLMMVGMDVLAFIAGISFGFMMGKIRRQMKYVGPLFFIIAFVALSYFPSVFGLILGSIGIGVANGAGIPYLNTIGSIKGGKEAAVTVMPLISASLYFGQFISPVVVSPMATKLFGSGDIFGSYKVGLIISFVYLLQVFATRKFQSLPPENKKS